VFNKRLQPFKPGTILPAAPFELGVGGYVLSGNITHATPNGLLFYRPANVKPKDLLRAWVEHLLYHATGGKPGETIIVGKESTIKIAPATDPLPLLGKLLDGYWAGLSQPLKFFPESSFAFAEADYKVQTGTQGRTTKSPIDFAEDKWNGNDFGLIGECQDKYISLFFKNADALAGDFETRAREVFHPLLETMEEVTE
jgi:exodeoxyribonuclease V gamma subunit